MADMANTQTTELQFVGGGSDKFYRIEQDDRSVTITYGRNGTAGQATTTPFPSKDNADKFVAKKLKEKLSKGYVPVTTSASSTPAAVVYDTADVDSSVLPMLAKVADPKILDDLMESNLWGCQLKMDGDRCVISVRQGIAKAYNRQGQPKKKNVGYEHLEAFKTLVGDWVFDGEIVGRTYHVFDVISAPRLAEQAPFTARYAKLKMALSGTSTPAVKIVPLASDIETKKAMKQSAIDNLDEGIIFRKLTGIYEPGRRSADLLKDKFLKEADCVISAFHKSKQSAELSVNLPDGDTIVVGNASTIGKGDLSVGDVVEVQFLYVLDPKAPTMFQPRIVRLRDDKAANECSIEQFEHAGTSRVKA